MFVYTAIVSPTQKVPVMLLFDAFKLGSGDQIIFENWNSYDGAFPLLVNYLNLLNSVYRSYL